MDNCDIITLFLTKMYNDSNQNINFPNPLKLAYIIPTHKKDDTTKKENYRPVSILPSVSKIYGRNMFDQISVYIENIYLLIVHNIVYYSYDREMEKSSGQW